jgi:hypothetical protein
MIPADKLVEHDPENGMYGDCMRATIASLLELKTSEVPHFFETGIPEDYDKKMEDFLKSRNLKVIYTGLDVTFHQDVYHIICGHNHNDVPHAVVGLNGKEIHDPNPNRKGLKSVDSFGFIVEDTDTPIKNLSEATIFTTPVNKKLNSYYHTLAEMFQTEDSGGTEAQIDALMGKLDYIWYKELSESDRDQIIAMSADLAKEVITREQFCLTYL